MLHFNVAYQMQKWSLRIINRTLQTSVWAMWLFMEYSVAFVMWNIRQLEIQLYWTYWWILAEQMRYVPSVCADVTNLDLGSKCINHTLLGTLIWGHVVEADVGFLWWASMCCQMASRLVSEYFKWSAVTQLSCPCMSEIWANILFSSAPLMVYLETSSQINLGSFKAQANKISLV